MASTNGYRASLARTAGAFGRLLPVLAGVLLLASLIAQVLPGLVRQGLFGHGALADSLTAAGLASVAHGQPVVSYLLGGELRDAGVSLEAVTAFITAWITVGVLSLPVEGRMLGWRFALWYNGLAFGFALAIAWLTVALLDVLS